MAWTTEQDVVLKECVERGLTFTQVAARLNAAFETAYSRNACIGRSKRQGFKSPNGPCVRNCLARKWTPQMDEVLVRVITDQGGTYADASIEVSRLGYRVSRNACIKRSRHVGCTSSVVRVVADVRKAIFGAGIRSKPTVLRVVEVEPRHLAVTELERGDCRYPYGGDPKGEPITFCGCPALDGLSYCAPHQALTRSSDQTRGGGRAAAELRMRLYRRNVA